MINRSIGQSRTKDKCTKSMTFSKNEMIGICL